MKKSIRHIGGLCLAVISLLAINSCTEDAFEQVVEIDLPEHKKQLAVTAEFLADDTVLFAVVSHSLGLLDTSGYDLLDQANVVLKKDGSTIGAFSFDSLSGKYKLPLSQPLGAGGGAQYTFEVSAEGFEDVRAEQTMPNRVPITDVTFTEDGAITEDGDKADELVIDINDPGSEENYYQVDVFEVITNYNQQYRNHLYTGTLDPIVEYGFNVDNLLKDVTFNGKVYPLRLHLSPYITDHFDEDTELVVRLTSITKDKYLYQRSWAQYDEARYNPFAEPVVVHRNFDNGFGIFTVESYVEYVVEL